MKKTVLIGLLALMLSACTVTQDVFLHRDGSGEVRIDIELDEMVTSYARDIYAGFTEDTGNIAIFDTAAVERYFLANPSSGLISLENPSPGSLFLSVRFTSAEDILDQDSCDLPPVIRVSESRGVTTVVFNLAPDNMRILTDPVSMTDTELIQVFGPQPDRPYTEEEYLEVIAYAFADYLDGDGAAGVLSAASVTVRVKTEGEIVGVSGGRKQGDTALFSIPFIDIVTMSEPIVLSVSYR